MAPLIDQLKAILPKILDVTTGLIKESENSLCGPCPKCGGEDRFVYKTDSGKFWCRQCRPAESTPAGDIIDFHKWLDELTTSDLIKKYFPKDEQGQKEPGKKEFPAELWASIIQKYTNDNPVYRLFSNRRKINKDAVSQVFAQGKVRFFKHRGKEAVACAFRELDGDQNVLAVQCLSVDEKAFSYTDKNKVFTKDSKASESCFFQAGTEIKKANQIIICEAVINAISGAECMPDACFLALGGSTLYKKVKGLRKYRDNGKQIICFFDNDEAGRKATQSVEKLLGVKTKSVKWSKNASDGQDINDLLKAGEHKTIIEMVNNALPVEIEKLSTSKDERKPTIADSLVLLAKENILSFFNDQLDKPYARFPVKDHFEHWPIRSKAFRVWLQGLYYKAENKGANSDAVNQALYDLEAIANFDGKGEVELHVRVCEHDGAYWYDLTNERWQAVKVTDAGWQVIDNPPVLFRRLAHQKPQALPERNATIAALRPFLEGIDKPKHKDLVTVWLISCLIPEFSHTILVPYGDQGSGKTTLSKNCKAIIDPSLIDTLGLVGEQRELVQTLSHHWLLPYDNLSSLSREVQNIFCRTITGASYCKRKLYSDGEVHRMERDGRANIVHLSAFNHPNVITGKDNIPGAVNRKTTIRRVNEWCRPLAPGEQIDGECFELPSFLEGLTAKSQSGQAYPPLKAGWYKIMESAFSYMVLGRYPAQGNTQLISKDWISKARARWDLYVSEHGEIHPQHTSAVMGLDVGEFGTDANVSCFRYGGYVEHLIAWSGVDTIKTGDRATAEYKGRDVSRANIDATGIGAGVAPHMQRGGCSAHPVKVASSPTEKTELGEFYILRDQLWWACREWLRTDTGAMLPPDELLIEELRTPTYEVVNGKIRVMKKRTMRELLKRSPDRADALCLTFCSGGFFADCDLT